MSSGYLLFLVILYGLLAAFNLFLFFATGKGSNLIVFMLQLFPAGIYFYLRTKAVKEFKNANRERS